MTNFDYDLGIIGCGAAGLSAGSGAAQLGAKTLMIEREKLLGGDCLHYGCVPSKTLIKSAKVYHMINSSKKFGLPKIDAPPVDFRQIKKRIQSVIDTIQKHDSEERFCELGAQVEFGTPRFTDEHSIVLNGKSYSAKNWLISSGSSPAKIPINGLDKVKYLTNKEIFYLNALPKSMIVLGGGPIGIEMAQAFNRLGTKVSVIQKGDQILDKEDKDMADLVLQVLKSEGITFHMDANIIEVSESGNQKRVAIEVEDGKGGVKKKTIKADDLLVAIGRAPNIEGLNLDGIEVKYNFRGIEVDRRMRTSHKHIYAAGDVAGGYQFTHAAGYEASVVVTNAIAHLPRRTSYDSIPWCTYTDPELSNIGMNEKTAKQNGIDYTVWEEEFEANDRSLAEGYTEGKIKMLLNEKEKPIGVQILGPSAGELLCEWVGVFNGKTKLSTLAGAVHPYPTLGEINRNVAVKFMSPKVFSNKVKKGLKILFKLKGRACETD